MDKIPQNPEELNDFLTEDEIYSLYSSIIEDGNRELLAKCTCGCFAGDRGTTSSISCSHGHR